MTDQEINIAIAEACPSIVCENHGRGDEWYYQDGFGTWHRCHRNSPLHGLNAMYEVENVLTDEQYQLFTLAAHEDTSFTGWLFRLMVRRTENPNFRTHSATARQRAEALLRVLGKWKE